MLCPMMVMLGIGTRLDRQTWYGPATATFAVQFAGDPYDPSENDVQVEFRSKKGRVERRIAYFDADSGAWKATLVAREPGAYKAKLIRNGAALPETDREGTLQLAAPLPHGFIRIDPERQNRFVWDDGTPMTPIGFDLGWQNGDLIPMSDQVAKMGKSGVNWTRIWATHFDGMNPWWPDKAVKLNGRSLWPPAIAKWDALEKACRGAGVGIQMCLYHHGQFSTKVNPNWQDNPWNVKNGGFLEKPGDFFTDPEAKARAKIWLRYAVARYGASPAIFGWELFNEVQWVDPIQIDHRWTEVDAWHKEMADYVRSIDPYHHPVTSSSELRPDFDASFDYLQPHTYPNNVFAAVLGTVMPENKPGFYGEFGPGNLNGADDRKVIFDGLLGGLLANHAGAGMFWYWDIVEKQDLYSEFDTGRKVADLSGWYRHPEAKLLDVKARTKNKSPFLFVPGGGWAPTTQSTFQLPEGATGPALNRISSYIQGKSHRDMTPDPIKLSFTLDQTAPVKIEIGDVSASGAALQLSIDGRVVDTFAYSPTQHPVPISISLPGGPHTLQIQNDGNDWFVLKSISIGDLSPQASVTAMGEAGWLMARLTRNGGGTDPLQVDLSSLPLSDGVYKVTEIDLADGSVNTIEGTVKDFETRLQTTCRDEVLVFAKR